MKLSAIVVSHHDQFRRDLAQFAEMVDSCIEVVSEVSTFYETLDQVAALRPDLALLDLGLRGGSALELTQRICRQWPETTVILVGHESARDYRRVALGAGALEYVDLLEVGTQLPAAMQLIEHPPECGASERMPHSEIPQSALVVNLRTRLRTAPTGPKHGPFTAWQYVHIALVLTFASIVIRLQLISHIEPEWLTLMVSALMGVCVIEWRQFIRARRAAISSPRSPWRGGAITI